MPGIKEWRGEAVLQAQDITIAAGHWAQQGAYVLETSLGLQTAASFLPLGSPRLLLSVLGCKER